MTLDFLTALVCAVFGLMILLMVAASIIGAE
jgi:hypothetical protein